VETSESYGFGPFVLDTARIALVDGEREVELRPKAFETLLALLRNAGRVVGKDELVAAVWPDVVVNDDALYQCVRDVRKAIADTEQRYIRTVSRRGYVFVHPVTPRTPPTPSGALEPSKARASISPTIAVMPFANLSSDPDQCFLADGAVEDLITALSRFRTFSVVSRSSSFVYKGRSVDAREAARELGVRYLLQGSVRRSGERIRVNAQLIEGATGAHLWAEKFDGAAADILDVQDTITETVIALIEPQIRNAEIERACQKRPETLDAWDLYVQALPLVHSGVVANWNRALDLLDRAVALDPNYAPALALAAWAHTKRHQSSKPDLPNHDTEVDLAIELADRAVAADPDDALALALKGWLRIHERLDFSGLDLMRQAVTLNPNNSTVLNLAAVSHLRAGDIEEARLTATRALELSPASPERHTFMTTIAAANNALGRHEEALNFAKRAFALEADNVPTRFALAISYAHLGQIEEARRQVAEVLRLRPDATIATVMVYRMQFPERVAKWVEGLRKAGMPDG
jgi:adenylate cyclase